MREVLLARASQTPDAVALLSPGRAGSLTFEQVLERTESIVSALHSWGIGRGDRIATFLPNGPEAAVLLLAITSCATYAPLNPRAHVAEIEKSLTELRARAVVVEKGAESPGRAAAAKLGLPIIELAKEADSPVGSFALSCANPPRAANARVEFAQPDDLLYVLQTSGTTARPKVVPLSQRSFLAAAAHNARFLGLTPEDCCLHAMASFHVMGITTVVFSLMAGAQVVSAPGPGAEFFSWVREFRPTWINGPPAIHQSFLRYVKAHRGYLAQHPPRFVRSSAALLSRQLLEEIERVWHAPLVEAYGMSESPLISANYAPPGPRKTGSVGLPCMDVAILDDMGTIRRDSAGITGEILVRGPQLMAGYEGNPANESAFIDGWFRTGDDGFFDGDGFLFLAGRRKEIINRGGSKISPREVDDVILSHPSVSDALTFAIPDARLGEDVAVAAVLKPGAAATELEIRQFAAGRLTEHKVPRRIVFLDEIPMGPTGKPQRIGLAAKLGLDQLPAAPANAVAYVAPRTPMEEALEGIWGQVLAPKAPLGIHANFMDLGGDSLEALAMFSEIHRLLGRELPVAALLSAPTIAQLAEALSKEGCAVPQSFVVPIQPRGHRTPLFCLPGMFGHAFSFYPLARHLGSEQPLYGLQLPEVYGRGGPERSIVELATLFVEQIRTIQPHGPYRLAGYSFGGYLAFEMAQQLLAAGEPIALLALFDTPGPGYPRRLPLPLRVARHFRLLASSGTERNEYVRRTVKRLNRRFSGKPNPPAMPSGDTPLFVEATPYSGRQVRLMRAYSARPFPGTLVLFSANEKPQWLKTCRPDPLMGWGPLAHEVKVYPVPGQHLTLLVETNAPALAAVLSDCLSGIADSNKAHASA